MTGLAILMALGLVACGGAASSSLPGLPSPLPAQGEAASQMVGDMTMHGVTSELLWDVTAEFAGDEITGRASTEFPFGKFDMTRPRVRLALSVESRIRLRIDFRLVKVTG